MDPQNESMGSEVWKRYGIGSMNDPGVDSIMSIYARVAPEERTGRLGRIVGLLSDLELQRSRTISGRVGDLVL